MPVDHPAVSNSSRNDDVERDLPWLQRKLQIKTYLDVDDVRCAVIVLKRWARLQHRRTGAQKFVGYVHHFVQAARVIQRTFRRYRFRRGLLLERCRLKWTHTWFRMIADEADRHRADTKKLLMDTYRDELAKWDQEGLDMDEVRTMFEGSLKTVLSTAAQHEVDTLCLMEAVMTHYLEASIRFRYRWRNVRARNVAYFEAASSVPTLLAISAMRRDGHITTTNTVAATSATGGSESKGKVGDFPVVFYDEYGAKISTRSAFEATLSSYSLFTEAQGNFTETRARYDLVVFANAVRDLGKALYGESSSRRESVRLLLSVSKRALDTSVRAMQLPAVPLARLMYAVFPELHQQQAGSSTSPSSSTNKAALTRRLSAYSMQHFATASESNHAPSHHQSTTMPFPPSDMEEEEDEEEDAGPFSRTDSEKRLSTEATLAARWEDAYEALPHAGTHREKVPWTVRLGVYSRLRRAKLILGEKNMAIIAAQTPQRRASRRRSSATFLMDASSNNLASSTHRRPSLGSGTSPTTSPQANSVRRTSSSFTGRKMPPHRGASGTSVAFEDVDGGSSEDDDPFKKREGEDTFGDGDGGVGEGSSSRRPSSLLVDSNNHHNSVVSTTTPASSPTPKRRSSRRTSTISPPPPQQEGMTSFLVRHALIHSKKSLMERKAIGEKMNGVVWKGRNRGGSYSLSRSGGGSGMNDGNFRPASPWGAPQLKYDARGPLYRVLPQSSAKRVAVGGRGDAVSPPHLHRGGPNRSPHPTTTGSVFDDGYNSSSYHSHKVSSSPPPAGGGGRGASSSPVHRRPLSVTERKQVVASLIHPRPTPAPLSPEDNEPLRPVLSETAFVSSNNGSLLKATASSASPSSKQPRLPVVVTSTSPTGGLDPQRRIKLSSGGQQSPAQVQHRNIGFGRPPSQQGSTEDVVERIRLSNQLTGHQTQPHTVPPHESPARYTGLDWHTFQSSPPSSSPSSQLMRAKGPRPGTTTTPEADRIRQAYHSHIKSL